MNQNQLAQNIFTQAYRDEMQKLAQVQPAEASIYDYAPAAAALAALPFLMNQGSIVGRKAGLAAVPVADWLNAKAYPAMGLGNYFTRTVGARSQLPHAGTLAGALAGLGGAALLYDYLKDKM